MARFAVDPASVGLRVDQFLARALPGTSVHAARRALAAGQVRVDDRPARKGDRLAAGQTITVAVDDRQPAGGIGAADAPVAPDPTVRLEVLYQDDELVAVNKPAGIASHPLRAGERGTAANGLVVLFPACASASPSLREGGLGHRLDRDTSGVLLAARHRAAWDGLRQALRDPRCEKTYVAQVAGASPAQGRSAGSIGRTGRAGARVTIDGGRNPLPAQTVWETLAAVGVDSSLVRARLHAGRAHQVRAHLAAAGHPILGDPLYGDAASQAISAAHGVASLRLHAESVSLIHPHTGAALVITAPLPDWAAPAAAAYSVSR